MQTTPDTLLVMGPNGSGKTTLLKAIGHLWHLLRLFLEGRSYTQAPRFSLFYNTQLAAMALLDFLPEHKFWIYQGHEDEVRPFLQEHQDEHKIGAVSGIPNDIKFTIFLLATLHHRSLIYLTLLWMTSVIVMSRIAWEAVSI